MKSGLRRRSSTKRVVGAWWERRRSVSDSSRNSLRPVRSVGTSRRAVNGKRRADRLIKHPWELEARSGCYHAAHARGAEQAMPPGPTLERGGDTRRARATWWAGAYIKA